MTKSSLTSGFHNRVVDQWLASELDIDIGIGLQYLNEYFNEISLRRSGVPASELNIGRKRHEQKSTFIPLSSMFDEFAVDKSENEDGIGVIKIDGFMSMEDGWSHDGMLTKAKEIAKFNQMSNVHAIMLDVNSGGGLSQAGSVLHDAVARSQKPVYSFVKLAASAAYHGVAPSDRIISISKDAFVGSIGSMITINRALVKYLEDNFDDIYSSMSQKKNEEIRAYMKGDKSLFILRTDEAAKHIREDVSNARELKGDTGSTLAGELIRSEDAVARGLVDEIMIEADMLEFVKSKVNKNYFFPSNSNTMSLKETKNALFSKWKSIFSDSKLTENSDLSELEKEMDEASALSKNQTDIQASLAEQVSLVKANADAIVKINSSIEEIRASVANLGKSKKKEDEEEEETKDDTAKALKALQDQNAELQKQLKANADALANFAATGKLKPGASTPPGTHAAGAEFKGRAKAYRPGLQETD